MERGRIHPIYIDYVLFGWFMHVELNAVRVKNHFHTRYARKHVCHLDYVIFLALHGKKQ